METHGRAPVLVLEDFEGIPLSQLMRNRQQAEAEIMPLAEFLHLAVQIVEGVASIHALGVIHKDLRPGSILINPNTGVAKITNFDRATAMGREIPPPPVSEGVLAYLSPEQTGRMSRAADYRDMTVAMLESAGYKVLAPATSLDALKHFKTEGSSIDLLITDVVMPEMSGAALRDKILEMRPETKVLFIFGYAGDIIAHHGVLDEGVNLIKKPFSMNELTLAVQTAMALK